MKKLYSFFLFGELILFSIIFSQSLYEVYGLSHIGDTKLAGYKIDKASSEMLGNVYDYLMKQDANIQIIKMPLSPPLSYLPPKQAAMGRFFSLPELTLPTPNFGPPFFEELNRFFQMRIIIWQSVSCPTVI